MGFTSLGKCRVVLTRPQFVHHIRVVLAKMFHTHVDRQIVEACVRASGAIMHALFSEVYNVVVLYGLPATAVC